MNRVTLFSKVSAKKRKRRDILQYLTNAKDVFVTGSGTSYYSALLAKHILSKYSQIRVETVVSSEFQYSSELLDENSVLIAISQSGETADVLQSVKGSREKGLKSFQ